MHSVTENFGDRKHCRQPPQLENGVKGLTGRQGGHRTAVDEDPLPRAHMHTHTHTHRGPRGLLERRPTEEQSMGV